MPTSNLVAPQDGRITAMRYTRGTTIGWAPNINQLVAFADVDFDTDPSAYVAGVWTCPSEGYYTVSSSVLYGGTFTTATNEQLSIVLNGSPIPIAYREIYQQPTSSTGLEITDTLFFNLGDTVSIYILTGLSSPVMNGTDSYTWISIAKINSETGNSTGY